MYFDQHLVQYVLNALNTWSWQDAFERMQAEINTSDDIWRQNAIRAFIGWMAAERGLHEPARELFEEIAQTPAYIHWAQVGQAYIAMRESKHDDAHKWLDRAASVDQPEDVLSVTIDHLRGTTFLHQDQLAEAQHRLCRAYEHADSKLSGANAIFSKGRILDSLGMVFDAKDNFYASHELFQRSITYKHEVNDLGGLAVTYGNLGRLFLRWGQWDRAETAFREDLKIAEQADDLHGQTVMCNWIGKVEMERSRPEAAMPWLHRGLELGQRLQRTHLQGFVRQDMATAALMQGKMETAARELAAAEHLFQEPKHVYGLTLTSRVRGILCRAQGDMEQSETSLLHALQHFTTIKQWDEAARTQREIARTRRQAGQDVMLVVQALNKALEYAEQCRRHWLIRELETELREYDEVSYFQRLYGRARGRDVVEDMASLVDGVHEVVTILFLDIAGSTAAGAEIDPEIVMITFNQMMAELGVILERHDARISSYQGDGFMAILRGRDHAERGVKAALEMLSALDEFNVPRKLLGQEPLAVRVGISTGEVCLGNVGTYAKMDFTALGSAANLAARLEGEALPSMPCISQSTYDWVQSSFVFADTNPRLVDAKGFKDKVQVWDVVSLKPSQKPPATPPPSDP